MTLRSSSRLLPHCCAAVSMTLLLSLPSIALAGDKDINVCNTGKRQTFAVAILKHSLFDFTMLGMDKPIYGEGWFIVKPGTCEVVAPSQQHFGFYLRIEHPDGSLSVKGKSSTSDEIEASDERFCVDRKKPYGYIRNYSQRYECGPGEVRERFPMRIVTTMDGRTTWTLNVSSD